MTIFFLSLCLILGGATYWMYRALGATKGALFAANRKFVHTEARLIESKRAGRMAEQRCMQALTNLQAAIAHAGHAMEVAGQIEAVGAEVRALFDYVAGPAALDPAAAAPVALAPAYPPVFETTPYKQGVLAS
jgi:hypothetical protein